MARLWGSPPPEGAHGRRSPCRNSCPARGRSRGSGRTRAPLDLAVQVLGHAEEFLEVLLHDAEHARLLEGRLLPSDLPQDRGDLALEAPDARLPRVGVDDRFQSAVAYLEILGLKPVGL